MNPILWIPIVLVVISAAVIDVWQRRIPNWLTVPAIISGLAAGAATDGWAGLGGSIAGVALAVALLGAFCWFRTMGMGDLKLCMAVGAWIGPSALLFSMLITAMAGGLIAVGYGLRDRRLAPVPGPGAALLTLPRPGSPGRKPRRTILDPHAVSIPYAPAIAIGVVFSFLAN
ncbi:MAG TPA: A24 family peptidase [Bryobacteraceae bacterium]|nr:A24 family peptidase [Bryobacteraceae bacterium]